MRRCGGRTRAECALDARIPDSAPRLLRTGTSRRHDGGRTGCCSVRHPRRPAALFARFTCVALISALFARFTCLALISSADDVVVRTVDLPRYEDVAADAAP